MYAGVAETSVYIAPTARGRGVGTTLMRALIDSTEAAGIWTLQTGIFPENAASIAIHQKVEFRIVGHRERIGQHHGAWRDTLFLERRSSRIQQTGKSTYERAADPCGSRDGDSVAGAPSRPPPPGEARPDTTTTRLVRCRSGLRSR